ncbi:MAG: 16S rRNA (guanine(966)-N(2))-methyltransferase RsmD [Lachnospiraceae bacterium]|nr:16S rRNA (guanine(966)-N(2))-methyltransferase RsmD [Lachnospiraceae bacterium]
MRVIAGKAKSLPLKTIEGTSTRPTTDRIKETLFNLLAPDIPGASFLDLFAGSGGIGIEALSRGAKEAVFVEKNRKAVRCIEENLRFTHLSDDARVLAMDVSEALAKLGSENKTFDIIFLDPPYAGQFEEAVLMAIARENLLSEAGFVVVEASLQNDLAELVSRCGFVILRDKVYKTNRHLFLALQ